MRPDATGPIGRGVQAGLQPGAGRAFVIVTSAALAAVYAVWAWRWTTRALTDFEVFQTGDWLINYQGGFVRRGLIGEVIWRLTPDGGSIIATTTVLQLVVMGALFALVAVLAARSDGSPAWFMLVLSPAFLLFPLVNPLGGIRKEVLGLLAIAILAVALDARRWRLWAAIAVLVFAIATLSHEANAVLLPVLLLLIWRRRPGPADRVWCWVLSGAALAAAGAAAVSAALAPGSAATVAAICRSWQARGLTECGAGALDALTLSVEASRALLVSELFPGYWLYGVALILALVPLVVTRFLPAHWVIAVVSLAAAFPLFWIAWDYGRWIFLLIGSLSIAALALGARTGTPRAMRVPWILAVAYCALWGINYYGNPAIVKGPVVDLAQTVWRALIG